MAKLDKAGITAGSVIQASVITNVYDALAGTGTTDIIIGGYQTVAGGLTASTISASSISTETFHAAMVTSSGETLALAGSLTVTGDTLAPVEKYSMQVFSPGLATSATEPFIVLTGGNVGIGTTVPAQKLHVVGSVSATSNVYIGANGVNSLFTATGNNKATIDSLVTATGNLLSVQDSLVTATGNLLSVQGSLVTATGSLLAVQDSLVTATGNNKSLIETTTGNIVTTFEASTGNLKAVQDSLVTATGNLNAVQSSLVTATGNLNTIQSSLVTATGNINTTFEASTGNLNTIQSSLVTATGNLNTIQSSLVTATGNIINGTEVFSGTNAFNGTISAQSISAQSGVWLTGLGTSDPSDAYKIFQRPLTASFGGTDSTAASADVMNAMGSASSTTTILEISTG